MFSKTKLDYVVITQWVRAVLRALRQRLQNSYWLHRGYSSDLEQYSEAADKLRASFSKAQTAKPSAQEANLALLRLFQSH